MSPATVCILFQRVRVHSMRLNPDFVAKQGAELASVSSLEKQMVFSKTEATALLDRLLGSCSNLVDDDVLFLSKYVWINTFFVLKMYNFRMNQVNKNRNECTAIHIDICLTFLTDSNCNLILSSLQQQKRCATRLTKTATVGSYTALRRLRVQLLHKPLILSDQNVKLLDFAF